MYIYIYICVCSDIYVKFLSVDCSLSESKEGRGAFRREVVDITVILQGC